MDTITHGIAGALIGKALFSGEDLFGPSTGALSLRAKNGSEDRPSYKLNPGRIVTWSLMLGAIFPDSDVLRDIFSHDRLLVVTWHRSITHSLLMLPLWAVLLAGITRAFTGWRKWEAPSFSALSGIYAVGILSHILLDLVTTFGTMIWSPLGWSRPAWDLIFIIDLTFTVILLVPQLIAWMNAAEQSSIRRMVLLCVIFMPLPFLISIFLQNVGAPISRLTTVVATALLGAAFVLPIVGGWGGRVAYAVWNRMGFLAACAYLGATIFAHHAAK